MSDVQSPTTVLAKVFIEAGWYRFIRDRRAPERWATWFCEMGICDSIESRPGEREYRLGLSKAGRELRQVLMELAAIAPPDAED